MALGQILSHRYTTDRERRTDFAKTLDSGIKAFVAADHAVMQLATRIATGWPAEAIQAHADLVSSHEIELRAAVFSMRTRLPDAHPVCLAFEQAEATLTTSWQTAQAMLAMPESARPMSHEWDEWEAAHGAYREAFERALDEGRRALRRFRSARRLPIQRLRVRGRV